MAYLYITVSIVAMREYKSTETGVIMNFPTNFSYGHASAARQTKLLM